jgi:hypothetical protein
MRYKKAVLSTLLVAWLVAPLAISAQTADAGAVPSSTPVVTIAPVRPVGELLPDTLAGIQATGEVKIYASDDLAGVEGGAPLAEYHVRQAASRDYGKLRVEVFETPNQFTAFGLFAYNAGLGGARPQAVALGAGGVRLDGALIFWKDNCVVRISAAGAQPARAVTSAHTMLGRAVADSIVLHNPALRPRLLESLPANMVARSERYFLGPQSLGAYVDHGREMFAFAGGAEAVLAEYRQAGRAKGAAAPPVKLVIVEYHTPQFATEAMAAATSYVESLTEPEREKIILKREGNFIVEAVGVENHELAQSLVASVKYPYVVKWMAPLPRMPKEDPLRAQKAAQLLISTFSLLGLLLLAVLAGGSIFGSIVFFRRRKQQRQTFSDAGGMLRLDLDPFESVILGLPPKRED